MKPDAWKIHVDCCGEKHAITIRSQGPVTLHAHRGQTSTQFALFEGTHNTLGCLEFLRSWRKGLGVGSDPDTDYPPWYNMGIVQTQVTQLLYAMTRMRRRMRRQMPRPEMDKPVPILDRSARRVQKAFAQAWEKTKYKMRYKTVVSGDSSMRCYATYRTSSTGRKAFVIDVRWDKSKSGRKTVQDAEMIVTVPLRWIRVHNLGASVVEGIIVTDLVTPYEQASQATRAEVMALHEVNQPMFGANPFTVRRAMIGRESVAHPWDALIWMDR